MSRIEELEQQLSDELTRQDWEGFAKTSKELTREYIKKLETVFTTRKSNLPLIMAAMLIHLKVLGEAYPLATIAAEAMANAIEYTAVVAEVPE